MTRKSIIEVTAAIIFDNDRFLICQRPKGKNCELLWEFPGGKIEDGETGESCVIRECQEELGIIVGGVQYFESVTQEYSDRTIHLSFYIARIISGKLERKEHAAFAWIAFDDLTQFTFCPADEQMLDGHKTKLIMACKQSQKTATKTHPTE